MKVGIETTNQKYMFIKDGACKRYFPIKDNKLDGDAFVQSLNSYLEKQDCQLEKLKADNERVREVNKILSNALSIKTSLIKGKDEKIEKLKKHIDIWCHPSQYTQLLKHENNKEIYAKVVRFINELAWQDVKYDAFQSTMGEFSGSPSAVPRYAKKYFDLWKEMFEEDLEQIEKEKKYEFHG